MFVVATAGHVDHGKSTLVRALTGMEPDRWAEERRRGMTIDLGFAWTTLPSGAEVAYVDVPGHQRFIANMLAGLGPAPAVLLVVAADEGWCRQSAEHLAAIDALRIRHAVLAITRCDLADPEPARAQALARISASGLDDVRSVEVCAPSGAGLDRLRAELDALLARLPQPDRHAPVRLWVDRAFTVRGSGTVVTGTLSAGQVTVGDVLDVDGRAVRVRGIESLGSRRDEVTSCARVALNLRGVSTEDVPRGSALNTPGQWWHTQVVDVRAGDDPLPEHLVLHVGTAAVPVRVRPYGGPLVRLLLGRALPLRAGDRGVLRDPGRQSVATGIEVLDADPPELARRGAAGRRAAQLARPGSSTPASQVARRGAVRAEHLRRLGFDAQPSDDVLLISGWCIAAGTWQTWRGEAGAAVEGWAARERLQPDIPLGALARELGLPDPALCAPLVDSLDLPMSEGRVAASRPPADLGAAEPGLRRLERRLIGDPFAAPDADELRALGLGRRELSAAERTGRVLLLAGPVVLLPHALETAHRVLAGLDAPFTLSEARQALHTTRRVAVPLLERLDELGRTERLDTVHRRALPVAG